MKENVSYWLMSSTTIPALHICPWEKTHEGCEKDRNGPLDNVLGSSDSHEPLENINFLKVDIFESGHWHGHITEHECRGDAWLNTGLHVKLQPESLADRLL
eukprot:scaffold100632_cov12-Tisochrysis_lutea.AAC.1